MKKRSKFSGLVLAALFTVGSINTLKAQDVSELIKSGPADATKLTQAYFSPAFKGFGFGMNSAWFNSAKTKKLGKFDLRIQGSGALVPTKDQSFNLSDLGLSSKLSYNQNATSPTFFGKDETGAEIKIKDDNGNILKDQNGNDVKFNLPNGTGFHIVPSPQIQLTVGLIKNTEVSLRYTPKIKSNDFGSGDAFGFGAKHEITKYLFPGKTEKLIPVDIALAVGYNQLNYLYNIKVADQLNEDPNTQGQDLNQRVEAKFSGFTVDAILSKKLSIFTPFVSVGYNTAKTQLDVLGKYTFQSGYNNFPSPPFPANTPDTSSPKYSSLTDPIHINQKDIAGVRANVGFELHLLFFRLYGSYSVGEYQAVTAGIGFGIGK
nr:DUF6588 family protein [uncultured Pedobacter sp.]